MNELVFALAVVAVVVSGLSFVAAVWFDGLRDFLDNL